MMIRAFFLSVSALLALPAAAHAVPVTKMTPSEVTILGSIGSFLNSSSGAVADLVPLSDYNRDVIAKNGSATRRCEFGR